ncbi:MAG: hypothetical protein LR011_05425, partial [Verrucomicrobia bacterium]|nr:hypothetical protein [Verrucomicrobiota bacterium]
LTKTLPHKKWVGLKAHLTHTPPIDHLQLHRVPLGYIGVSPIENGHINVCGLFDFTSLHPKPDNLHATLLGSLDHSPLGTLIRSGTLESDSFCSISNLNLIPASLHSLPHEWRIGDSFSMIPPFTGNGMSMAMESARIALPYVLNAFLRQASWSTQRTHFHQRLSRHFRPRLTAAHYLHKSLLTPQLGPFLFTHLPRSRPLFHALFALTH